MLFAGEDGLENIDPNERGRRERNAAMTEEDKEKRCAKARENYHRNKSKKHGYTPT